MKQMNAVNLKVKMGKGVGGLLVEAVQTERNSKQRQRRSPPC